MASLWRSLSGLSGSPNCETLPPSRALWPFSLSLAHLEYFVKGGVEGVLLHFGLPLAALRLVGQQVHFDVAAKEGKRERRVEQRKYSIR